MIDRIKDILQTNNSVEFRIYSLSYIIENKNTDYIIYPKNDINRKKIYKSLDELFKKYEIYNESLKTNEDKIDLNI